MIRFMMVALFVCSSVAFAKDDLAHEIPLEPLAAEELKGILNDAHAAIESAETGNLLQRWIAKFNLKATGLASYRWYLANRTEPHAANAAANISLMLVASHAMEMAGGLGLASNGVVNADGFEQLVYTAVGFTVTIPGLDPLCLLLVGGYAKWPQAMDKMLTKPRMFVVNSAHAARKLVGLPEGWFSIAMENHRRRHFLNGMERAGDDIAVFSENGNWLFNVAREDGTLAAQLKFEPQSDGKSALTEVYFDSRPRSLEWLRNLRPFGTNISTFVRDLEIRGAKGLPYVREIQSHASGTRILLKPEVFPFINLNHKSCDSLLISEKMP